MTDLSQWIYDQLEEYSWDNTQVYALYRQCPYNTVISEEGFKRKVRKIRTRFGPDERYSYDPIPELPPVGPMVNQASFQEQGNEATLDVKTTRITTLEELLCYANVDLSIWKVERHTINKWEVGAVVNGVVTPTSLFQVKATLVKIIMDDPIIPVVQPLNLPLIPYTGSEYTSAPVGRILVLGDAQIGYARNIDTEALHPFHCESSLSLVLEMVEDNAFDEIVVLGDMLDLTEASKYVQKPEFHLTIQPAINRLGTFLVNLRQLAPQAKITYLCGNHEERLQRQLVENFKFAYGLKAFGDTVPFYSLRRLLDLDKISVDFIEAYPSGQYWLNDDIVVVHGEFVKLSTVSTTSNVSTIMGHLHKEEVISKTVWGRNAPTQVKSVTIGCLCKIDGTVPGVTSRPNWQNGVAVVEMVEDIANINHITFKNGQAIYNGRYYNGN